VGGAAGTSCNDCHASNGHPSWQTDCTFCHGTAGRAFNQAGPFPGRLVPTLAELAASPPVGPQGQLSSTEAQVGAHQKHVNPPAAGARSIPIACSDCHATPLPTGIAHVDGLRAPLPFGGIALTGSITNASFNPGTLTCSNTYCHGNFPQGTLNERSINTPSWTGAATSCTSCHTLRFWGHTSHQSTDNGCADCHEGYSASTVNVTLHVNGVKNVGGPATSLGSAFSIDQFGVKTCSNVSCHGWGGPDGW
jgi:predicted CxxxxCH...CXXCH cytochrome family protein